MTAPTRYPLIPPHLFQVALVIPLRLVDRIAAKLLQKSISQNQSDHRFTDDTGSRNGARIGALMLSDERFLGNHVDGTQRFFQRGNGLQITHDTNFFAVGNTALEAARAVREMKKTPFFSVIRDLVVRRRSPAVSNPN